MSTPGGPYDWRPDTTHPDPHDVDYDVVYGGYEKFAGTGETAPNIIG